MDNKHPQRSHLTLTWSQERYLAAWHFAAEAHLKQTLPGSDLPYVVHISSVAMEVMTAYAVEQRGDSDLAIQCALLHDTIEDAGIEADHLEKRFGPAVRAGVQALTKNPELPKAAAMNDSLMRIRQQPRDIWIVKLADRISNLGPPPKHWGDEKIERYRHEATEILAALGEASPFLAERLSQKIRDFPPTLTT